MRLLPQMVQRPRVNLFTSFPDWGFGNVRNAFRSVPTVALCVWLAGLLLVTRSTARGGDARWFGIHVIDVATGRGVPLVELRTVNDVAFVTDSAGWVAFQEPGLMDREVYFAIESPGYEREKDGFGNRGVRLDVKPGATGEVKLRRTNIAERIARLTGQGIYRDSTLLGQPAPLAVPNLNAGVLGQDSVQAVPYGDRIFWLWGDTNLAHYPLGNFRTTAATTPLDAAPERLDFRYFTDPEHPDRVRGMIRETEPGPVWLFGLLTVPDAAGKPALLAHYSRHRSLAEVAEHGLVRFDDASGLFEKQTRLDLAETWRFPRGNAVRVTDADGDYWYFAAPFAHTRVAATLDAVLDPTRYEALAWDGAKYAWTAAQPPTTQPAETALIRSGKRPASAARFATVDTATGKPLRLHGGSIAWNDFRHRWTLLAVQEGASESYLGEVWYAEADAITGPWTRAVKVATHPRYSFYNPRQHPFFATDGGRFIYFEGTYTKTFSGNSVATPRYEYNQLLYRLDLADERLHVTPATSAQ